MNRSLANAAVWLFLLAPLVAGFWLARQAQEGFTQVDLFEDVTPTAIEVDVLIQPVNFSLPGTLALQPTGQVEAFSGGSLGVVEKVLIHPGDQLAAGSAVAVVDGIEVRLIGGDAPLARDVSVFSPTKLQERVRNYLSGQDLGTDSPSLSQQIRAYQRMTGSRVDGIFRAAEVIWIPDTLTLAATELVPGRPFPDLGSVVLESEPSSYVVEVLDTDGQTPFFVDTPFDASVALSVGEDGPSIDAILTPIGTLEVSGDEAVALFRAAGTPVEDERVTMDVRVRVSSRSDFVAFPTSALIIDARGAVCVEDPDGKSIEVEPVFTDGGAAYVQRDGHVPAAVVVGSARRAC